MFAVEVSSSDRGISSHRKMYSNFNFWRGLPDNIPLPCSFILSQGNVSLANGLHPPCPSLISTRKTLNFIPCIGQGALKLIKLHGVSGFVLIEACNYGDHLNEDAGIFWGMCGLVLYINVERDLPYIILSFSKDSVSLANFVDRVPWAGSVFFPRQGPLFSLAFLPLNVSLDI